MLTPIDLANSNPAPSGGETTYQPRHNRYALVSTPASTGTITPAEGVSICEGYEAYAEVLEYSEMFGIMAQIFVTTDPFPIPASVVFTNPATGAWDVIDPRDGQPFTPLTAFVIIYRCKIPLADWDESAPLYR